MGNRIRLWLLSVLGFEIYESPHRFHPDLEIVLTYNTTHKGRFYWYMVLKTIKGKQVLLANFTTTDQLLTYIKEHHGIPST